jgi:hypothetical protein
VPQYFLDVRGLSHSALALRMLPMIGAARRGPLQRCGLEQARRSHPARLPQSAPDPRCDRIRDQAGAFGGTATTIDGTAFRRDLVHGPGFSLGKRCPLRAQRSPLGALRARAQPRRAPTLITTLRQVGGTIGWQCSAPSLPLCTQPRGRNRLPASARPQSKESGSVATAKASVGPLLDSVRLAACTAGRVCLGVWRHRDRVGRARALVPSAGRNRDTCQLSPTRLPQLRHGRRQRASSDFCPG